MPDAVKDLFTPELMVYYLVLAVLGGLAALSSSALKRGWAHMMMLHAAVISMSNPDTGIHADIKGLRVRMNDVHRELKDKVDGVAQQMKDLRENGHAFSDRVANIEERVQQGAVELNEVRRVASELALKVTHIDNSLGGR